MQDVQIGVSDDVCRDGEREQQTPFKKTPPRKVVSRYQPCGDRADDGDERAHAYQKQQRFPQRRRQNIGDHMRPKASTALGSHHEQRSDGNTCQRGNCNRCQAPARSRLASPNGTLERCAYRWTQYGARDSCAWSASRGVPSRGLRSPAQLSKPTRSASSLAAFRKLTALAMSIVSGWSAPYSAISGSTGALGLTGYS